MRGMRNLAALVLVALSLLLVSGVQLTAQTTGEVVPAGIVQPEVFDTTKATSKPDTQAADSTITNEMVLAAYKNLKGGESVAAQIQKLLAVAPSRALQPCLNFQTWYYLTPKVPTLSIPGSPPFTVYLDLWNTDFTTSSSTARTLVTAYNTNKAYFLNTGAGAPGNSWAGRINAWIYIPSACLGWYTFAPKVYANPGYTITFKGYIGNSTTPFGTYIVTPAGGVMPYTVKITTAGWYRVYYDQQAGEGWFVTFGVEYLGS